MAANNTREWALKQSIQTKKSLASTFSFNDLEKAYFSSLNSSRTDSIRAFLQAQTGLTTTQSLGDLWRQFFIGKGVTNQISLTDMANAYFSGSTLP